MKEIGYLILLFCLLIVVVVFIYDMYQNYYKRHLERQQEGFGIKDLGKIFKAVFQIPLMAIQIVKMFVSYTKALVKLPNILSGIFTMAEGGFEFIVKGVPVTAKHLIPDSFKATLATLLFGFTYVQCAISMMNNFPQCFIWYAIEIAGIILYLPIKLMFWILGLQFMEKIIWNLVYSADKWVYLHTGGHKNPDGCSGLHICHYPCWIINMCYRCKLSGQRKLTPKDKKEYAEKIQPLIDDFTPGSAVYNALVRPVLKFLRGGQEVGDALS